MLLIVKKTINNILIVSAIYKALLYESLALRYAKLMNLINPPDFDSGGLLVYEKL